MDITQYELLLLAGGLIGSVFKFHGDYTKLSERVRNMEQDCEQYKEDMKQLLVVVQEIKLLLAKNKVV
tara:strand:+ start:754 stop:957 length:204 start_codon:yes stop_codon:yes gene_type:complete